MTDGNKGVKARANSSKIALFSLWFNSINFRLPKVDVCGDDQGTANEEEANKPDIGTAAEDRNIDTTGAEEAVGAEDPDISTADAKEADRADDTGTANVEADRADDTGTADAKNVDKPDTDTADVKDVDKPDTGTTDAEDADKPDTGTADVEDADKPDIGTVVEDSDTATADVEEAGGVDGADKPGTDTAAKDSRRPPADKQAAARQTAARVSLFSFRKLLCFFSPHWNQRLPALWYPQHCLLLISP